MNIFGIIQAYNTENHLYEEINKPTREKLQTAATCHASFRILYITSLKRETR